MSQTEADQETEANRFAMALLMPEDFLTNDLFNQQPLDVCDDERIRKLAVRYKVTEQLMTLRLHQLGMFGVKR